MENLSSKYLKNKFSFFSLCAIITDSGIGYGYENINRCYCINREEAFKLHNELLKFGMNVPVNDLYTTRDLSKKTNKTKPESPEKKPWYRRR